MRNLLYILLLQVLFCSLANGQFSFSQTIQKNSAKYFSGKPKTKPYDYFFEYRYYPDFENALPVMEGNLKKERQRLTARATPRFDLSWETEGPLNIGGRINCIAVHPTNANIIYIGTPNGGIYKTLDGGNIWTPIFDNQNKLSIGEITINPLNPNVIYVGTGDPNTTGYTSIGDGIYRSNNGGATWENLGLANDRIVSKIWINPSDTNMIFCSTMGNPFNKTSDRGLYKSTNRGGTWSKIFYLSDSVGIADFEIHPNNSNIIYATAWPRLRSSQQFLAWGVQAGIYKTTDGGANWTKLTNGLPTGVSSRVTIEISTSNPNKLYAHFVDTELKSSGVYLTTNGGANWSFPAGNNYPFEPLSTFAWYFDALKINPQDDNHIFLLGMQLYESINGAQTFNQKDPNWYSYEVHADKHDLVMLDNSNFLLATDGGMYQYSSSNASWQYKTNIPNTEFYHIAVNPHNPNEYAGGAQDNGTSSGNKDIPLWPRHFGGDGFNVVFDPSNAQHSFIETQWGNVYESNSGWGGHSTIFSTNERVNWDMPFVMHPNETEVITGTYRVQTSSGNILSPNLNDIGNPYGERFHNITTLNLNKTKYTLYAGTSDANVWRSEGSFTNWTNITGSLPEHYITRITPSKIDSNRVFICHSGYKLNDNIPRLHMSNDKGNSWIDISGNLPDLAINDVEATPYNDSILFVANDGGVYYTMDMGANWERLGKNLPYVWVFDIEIDTANRILIAGTYARSIQSIPIDSIIAPFIKNYQPSFSLGLSNREAGICQGDTVDFSARGAATYLWSPPTFISCTQCNNPRFYPPTTQKYYIEGTKNGITKRDSILIVVHNKPKPIITANQDTIKTQKSGLWYLWWRGDLFLQNSHEDTIITKDTGWYKLLYLDTNGCISDTIYYHHTIKKDTTPNTILSTLRNISAYYSLTSNEIIIQGNTPEIELEMYSIDGREMLHYQNNIHNIDCSRFKKGIYILKFSYYDVVEYKKIYIDGG